jgi:hypothetical protein
VRSSGQVRRNRAGAARRSRFKRTRPSRYHPSSRIRRGVHLVVFPTVTTLPVVARSVPRPCLIRPRDHSPTSNPKHVQPFPTQTCLAYPMPSPSTRLSARLPRRSRL